MKTPKYEMFGDKFVIFDQKLKKKKKKNLERLGDKA